MKFLQFDRLLAAGDELCRLWRTGCNNAFVGRDDDGHPLNALGAARREFIKALEEAKE